jgi:plasmid stability protein
MKNVTITLDEEVARWARIWAAEHDTSVSRMLGEVLKEKMLQESAYRTSMERYFAVEPRPLRNRDERYSREDIHDRKIFR